MDIVSLWRRYRVLRRHRVTKWSIYGIRESGYLRLENISVRRLHSFVNSSQFDDKRKAWFNIVLEIFYSGYPHDFGGVRADHCSLVYGKHLLPACSLTYFHPDKCQLTISGDLQDKRCGWMTVVQSHQKGFSCWYILHYC